MRLKKQQIPDMPPHEPLPRFPIPFWDADTVRMGRFRPVLMEELVLHEPRTVMERELDNFTSTIRQKPSWWTKVFQSEVVQRWELEASEQGVDRKMFKFALQVITEFSVRRRQAP